jgi:YidC/Oxa1 family membrane protein insertase
MVLTTFLTQRQIMRKNMPPEAMEGPFAQQQKILLYVLPLVFAFSGVYFPLGVVIYWLTSNIWTMGQQFYVIRRMPAPGSPAEEARRRRMESKSRRRGEPAPEVPADGGDGQTGPVAVTEPARRQPKRTTRAQRKGKR